MIILRKNIFLLSIYIFDIPLFLFFYTGKETSDVFDPGPGGILQLSSDGLRLIELKGLTHIADFKINSYNDSLVVCDYRGNNVDHIRQNGNRRSRVKKRLSPHKVYI